MLRDKLKSKPPTPALLRAQHSLMALTVLGLIAGSLLMAVPIGRHTQVTVDGCGVSDDLADADMNLPHVAQALAVGGPVVIVAFGSSSTYGTGASARDKTYPSRLIGAAVPGHEHRGSQPRHRRRSCGGHAGAHRRRRHRRESRSRHLAGR